MNITAFLLYCVIVTFTPGPTNIVILATVQNFGPHKAMQYVYGATAAFGLLLVSSVILNSLLMIVIPKILLIMQAIGRIYILYLACQIYHMDAAAQAAGQAVTFRTGFQMQFLNPKVVLFTMTVIPSFVMPYDTSATGLAIAVAAITIIGFLAFITWVAFGAIFRKVLLQYQKAVNLIMALFLVYSAVVIAGITDLGKG